MTSTPRVRLNRTRQIREGIATVALRDARGAVTPPGKKGRARAKRLALRALREGFERALAIHACALEASEPETPREEIAKSVLAHTASLLGKRLSQRKRATALPECEDTLVQANETGHPPKALSARTEHILSEAIRLPDARTPAAATPADPELERLRDAHPEVVLYAPQIPPNTGTVARLCAALQARLHLVEPLGFDVSDKAVRRAGLDYWSEVDVTVHGSLDALLEALPGRRLVLVETGGTFSPMEFAFAPGDLLIFGSETQGLPEAFVRESVLKRNAALLTIPMHSPKVRSINLANTVSMVLFVAVEKLRAARTKDGA